jgi:dienelactone hydrolase
MTPLRPVLILFLASFLSSGLTLFAQQVATDEIPRDRRPLEHEDAARWKEMSESSLSPRGDWVTWREVPANGDDGRLIVASRLRKVRHVVERGRGGRFDFDERFFISLQDPTRAERRAAKDPAIPAKDRPKAPAAQLVIIDLASGARRLIPGVESFSMPERGGDHLLLFMKAEKAKKKDESSKAEGVKTETPLPAAKSEATPKSESKAKPESKGQAASAPAKSGESVEERRRREAKKKGRQARLIDLRNPEFKKSFSGIGEALFARDGSLLVIAFETRAGKDDGVRVLKLAEQVEEQELATGEGRYRRLSISRQGDRLAFLSDRDDRRSPEPAFALYGWKRGEEAAAILASSASEQLSAGHCPSLHRSLRFSHDGRRLFFGVAAAPQPPAPKPHPEDDFALDIWHWRDPLIQPEQLKRRNRDLQRNWLAVVHLPSKRIVELGRPEIPEIRLDERGEASHLLGRNDAPYLRQRSHDTNVPADLWSVNVNTGEARLLARARPGMFRPSPGGAWVAGWEGSSETWRAFELATGREVELSRAISASLVDPRHDAPRLPGPAGGGLLGWLADDRGALISDGHDLWLVDPGAAETARRVTAGLGRGRNWRFRPLSLDPETRALDPKAPLLLDVFDYGTKSAGFAELRLDSLAPPRLLHLEAAAFGRPRRALRTEVLLYTRETFRDFPDLWTTEPDFGDRRRISDVNPQQAGFNWGTVRLERWPHPHRKGEMLEGLLYLPEGFDPRGRYPLVTYFYERNADNLHRHDPPNPHRSVIRKSFYVSRGYCVFVPDIVYEIGHPGRSGLDCVGAGLDHVLGQGFIDPERVGVQGHSWGGYQIAWMVTHTNRFACAIAGAPVANMTSAYGGIRWGTGMSRQFQYEKTQSRLGVTPWDEGGLELYLENSPFVHADRVETPLLILHNDQDGAVPWYQGIEMFMALRRLEKPTWMLNYNGQPHWVTTWPSKSDYARRMQQFLDHFLMDAPLPRWLARGIPATKRGEERGFEAAENPAIPR